MGFLVPRDCNELIKRDVDVEYELDRYVLEYGSHGYIKRIVAESGRVLGSEYREIKQLNFSNPSYLPGPLCQMGTLYGRKPYVVALAEHPHALYLAQHGLRYNVAISDLWNRTYTKQIPLLDTIYGNTTIGFLSPEPPPEEES